MIFWFNGRLILPNLGQSSAKIRNSGQLASRTFGITEKRSKKNDLVVIGGGYSGMGAAISGARMGCKVALIQDRPVLGGNGSSEVESGQEDPT